MKHAAVNYKHHELFCYNFGTSSVELKHVSVLVYILWARDVKYVISVDQTTKHASHPEFYRHIAT